VSKLTPVKIIKTNKDVINNLNKAETQENRITDNDTNPNHKVYSNKKSPNNQIFNYMESNINSKKNSNSKTNSNNSNNHNQNIFNSNNFSNNFNINVNSNINAFNTPTRKTSLDTQSKAYTT